MVSTATPTPEPLDAASDAPDDVIAAIVDNAPPLSAGVASRLQALLRGAA